ncbi:hypothetical protein QOZ96_002467 [Brevundimonas nasdae]|uniref:hypothetical protein n=1 Tax=Brevundimonas nasdae TaxID=172043 RepID=UPI0019114487|nr:hypothetical protein [Brevundimonas nasdae]MBK6026039.1 hypothetical protein [Brevundimonas nasdae]MDQ0452514.1 hypothetical protein [Brevundimonas nasdae]
MIAWLSAAAAAFIVGLVVMAAIIGWGARVTRCQRIGLCVMAGGLVWAAPARLFGAGPGLPDLMFLSGLALYLAARHGKRIMGRVDQLDGVEDGRMSWRRRPF